MLSELRILLVGDDEVGKTSLIIQLLHEEFSPHVQHVYPEVTVPPEIMPERVTTYIVDSSARPENRSRLEAEMTRANVICIVYAIDNPSSSNRIAQFWIPFIKSTGVNIPLVLVGNKMDLRDENSPHPTMEQTIVPIMEQNREIETCMECSALAADNVSEVFYLAQKAVLHPTTPLYDSNVHELKPACQAALLRIFKLCDKDKDQLLNNSELNEFQKKCFNMPLQHAELDGVKGVVLQGEPLGIVNDSMTEHGFLYLNTLFVQRGRLETTWTILRRFGYGDDLQLQESFLYPPITVPADASVELAFDGYHFFSELFQSHDRDRDGALSEAELNELFSTTPENPFKDVEETSFTNDYGYITLQGFLARWSMMTILDYRTTLAYLAYLGFENDRTAALRITPAKAPKGRSQRNTYLCYVLGAAGCGKTSLLRKFIGKRFSTEYEHTQGTYNVVNSVEMKTAEKYLVMQEFGSRSEGEALSSRKRLDRCDLILLLYDISDPHSFSYIANLISTYNLYSYPLMIVGTKSDLDTAVQKHEKQPEVWCRSLGVDEPRRWSNKETPGNDVYAHIVKTIVNPRTAIPRLPSTKEGQTLKVFLMTSAVLVTLLAVGFSAWRLYRTSPTASTGVYGATATGQRIVRRGAAKTLERGRNAVSAIVHPTLGEGKYGWPNP